MMRIGAVFAYVFFLPFVGACSYMCGPNDHNFGSSLFRSNIAARVTIWKDLSPPPDPFFPWGTRYYQGNVREVYKGVHNITTGKVVIAGGSCGGRLTEKTSVLFFGDIKVRTVHGFAAPVPVLVPTSCTYTSKWYQVTKQQRDRLRNYHPAARSNPCLSVDCARAPPAFVPKIDCPGNTKETGGTVTCSLIGNTCGWIATPGVCT